MCGGGGGNSSAQIAAQQEADEAARQARIRAGAKDIETAFGRFDDDFYDGFRESFLGFYTPQLDRQHERAKGAVTTSLLDRGILESTAGFRALGDIAEASGTERTTLANRSVDEANALRGRVSSEKSNLYALNEQSADPERMGALISGSEAAIAAPQAYSPLEDVFASLVNSATNYQIGLNNRAAPVARARTTPRPGTSSGRIVKG